MNPEGGSSQPNEKFGVFLMIDSLQIGGTERQFTTLTQKIDREQFCLRLGCLQRKGPFLESIGEISEFRLGGSFFTVQAQRARWELRRQLRAERISIVHAFDFYSNLMLLPTARMAGIPILIGSHRQLGDLLSTAQLHAQGLVFRLCNRVVCNSRAAADRLVDRGLPEHKIAVIPNALPEAAFDHVPPALPRSSQAIRVGMIARMNNRVKNHVGLLHAIRPLVNKFPHAEFLFVGDGPLRPELESLSRDLGIERSVKFLGERTDIPNLLEAMDISVNFSLSESSSNSVLESMAKGVAVVASRVGGTPEIIRDGETGLLVESGNGTQLAEALECLIVQPALRAQLGANARAVARRNFSTDFIVRQYEWLYRQLLAERVHSRKRIWKTPDKSSVDRRIRIAIVAASPRWIGGQSVQATILCRNWQMDPEVSAQFIPIDPDLPQPIRWIEKVPLFRTIARLPFYLGALWWGIADKQIVHIFSASYWSFLIAVLPAWLVARVKGKKTLIHYHSGEAGDHLRRSAIACRVLKKTKRLVVPSRYLVDVFREFSLDAQAVPNVIDPGRFRFRLRCPLRPLLVNTRGFHPYYGIDMVVRAFASVRNESSDARLVLVGRGPIETEIRELVREIGSFGIGFAGSVNQDKIAGVYDQNDIFVNGSCLDNSPVSILEAFASGTPVVSTSAGGIGYMVEHERTGLLCAPGDWRGLAANVLRLLRDSRLAEYLARNAFEEVKQYSWEQVRSHWLQVYQSLLKRPKTEDIRPADSVLSELASRSYLIRKELPKNKAV